MLNRRKFISGTCGSVLTLPWLNSFAAGSGNNNPQRLLLICIPLGLYSGAFKPEGSGKAYKLSEYLNEIKTFKNDFSVISGLDHPGVGGGHATQPRIFTGVPSNSRNRRSLDQYVASHVGKFTRYDSLTLSSGVNNFSWTDGGTLVPPEKNISDVYTKLFTDEKSSNKKKVLQEIGSGKSILDFVARDARQIEKEISSTDKRKLHEYFESVRDFERKMLKSESWINSPKPKVNEKCPPSPADSKDIVTHLRSVFDISRLAFQTDSTRVISFGYFRQGAVNVQGVSNPYHPLSHHGKDEGNIAQLKLIEKYFFTELNKFLQKMKSIKEGSGTLLDNTTVLVTSNLGNGSNHSNKNLPVLLIGGGFDHGAHLDFESGSTPLCNLYLSMLHNMGIKDESFGTSSGLLTGLNFGA